MLEKLFSLMSAVAPNAWWTGAPIKLVRKTTIVAPVAAAAGANAIDGRLPVYTMTFEIPRGHEFSGKAQPIENVRMDMGDVVKMVIPGYKPKSYSMSALREDENEFDITVKVYPDGRASGYLDSLQIGNVTNAFGMKSKRSRNPGKFFGGVAYGVGITETLPVAQAELEKGDAEKVVVIWAGRTSADTFWHDRIELLESKYGDKFEMIYMFSREEKPDNDENGNACMRGHDVLYGHLGPSVLKEVFETRMEKAKIAGEDARFLAIGTKPMIALTEGWFTQIGYPMPKHCLLPKNE